MSPLAAYPKVALQDAHSEMKIGLPGSFAFFEYASSRVFRETVNAAIDAAQMNSSRLGAGSIIVESHSSSPVSLIQPQ
jgi:hypothetical protein